MCEGCLTLTWFDSIYKKRKYHNNLGIQNPDVSFKKISSLLIPACTQTSVKWKLIILDRPH